MLESLQSATSVKTPILPSSQSLGLDFGGGYLCLEKHLSDRMCCFFIVCCVWVWGLRWKNAEYESEADEDEDEDEKPKNKVGKAKKGKAGKKGKSKAANGKENKPKAKKGVAVASKTKPPSNKADAKQKAAAAPSKKPNYGEYVPGEYAAERKRFIKETMGASKGISYRDASSMWDESDRRTELLSHMPRKELIRRRFI